MNAVLTPHTGSGTNPHEPSSFGHALAVTCGILCPLVAVFSLVQSLVVGFDLAGSVGFALIIAGAIYGSGVMESDH